MGSVIGELVVPAIVVALSPPPIIAVVLILLSPRARNNGPAFAFGWVLGLAIVGSIALALAGRADIAETGGESSAAGSILHLAIGLALIGLAYK